MSDNMEPTVADWADEPEIAHGFIVEPTDRRTRFPDQEMPDCCIDDPHQEHHSHYTITCFWCHQQKPLDWCDPCKEYTCEACCR